MIELLAKIALVLLLVLGILVVSILIVAVLHALVVTTRRRRHLARFKEFKDSRHKE